MHTNWVVRINTNFQPSSIRYDNEALPKIDELENAKVKLQTRLQGKDFKTNIL